MTIFGTRKEGNGEWNSQKQACPGSCLKPKGLVDFQGSKSSLSCPALIFMVSWQFSNLISFQDHLCIQASQPFWATFHGYFFPFSHVFMVIFSLKFMVFMFFWTQFKEFLVQIELWRRQIFTQISYFVREKCWLFRSPQVRIIEYIARRRRKFWGNFGQKSLFSWFFWTNLDFHGFHGWAPFSWFSWLSESPDRDTH